MTAPTAACALALVPLLPLLLGGCGAPPRGDNGADPVPEKGPDVSPATPRLPARLLRGRPVSDRWARLPGFPPRAARGLHALPDGSLEEWQGRAVHWNRTARPVGRPAGYRGRADLHAPRFGLASYGSGVSLALEVFDDSHRPAVATGVLGSSDHVEVELFPGDAGPGVKLQLGTLRKLVRFVRPAQAWRERDVSAAGVASETGYRVEARVPLSTLTPLSGPRIAKIRYRVTLHDADADDLDGRTRPTLRFEGSAVLSPPLEVPEAVQRRTSVRICAGSQADALWSFRNGWRCAVPYRDGAVPADDTAAPAGPRPGRTRIPSAPRIVWIRERLMFINFIGARRGLAALVDRGETILSVMPLGVVGSADPGKAALRFVGRRAPTLRSIPPPHTPSARKVNEPPGHRPILPASSFSSSTVEPAYLAALLVLLPPCMLC